MGATVLDASGDEVVLHAPIDPNLNHRDTAFGGSLAALAILAGWCVVHLGLREAGVQVRTVIQASEVDFTAPVHTGFRAVARRPRGEAWSRLLRALDRWGRGRVRVRIELSDEDDAPVASMEADYVALGESAIS